MLLAIDCGNTNTKFGLYAGTAPDGRFAHVFRMETDATLRAEAYRVRLAAELDSAGLADVEIAAAGLATVVPKARDALVAFARAVSGSDPVEPGAPGVALGLDVLLDRPAAVGADRLAAAVGAHAGWPGDKIVIDFGTATTFDVVTAQGAYAGGVIAPGIDLALDALHAGTALLPRVPVVKPARVVGTDTVSAMQSGIYWGYVGLIEGIVARIRAERATGPVTVVATGGLATLFADGTPTIDAVDGELTLRGIVLVTQMNRPGPA